MHISLFVRVNAQLHFFMRRLLFQLTYPAFWSIEKVNAQLPDLNGGVVRLLLQMKKQDSPLIFVVRLLLQMMRLPLQNCIYSYK